MNEMWNQIKYKANVIGYSKKLRPRIKNGKITEELCFRVYVTKKMPSSALKLGDIVPSEIAGTTTDVVEIGEMRAMEHTEKVRPLVAGISIGNWGITAGTLGWFFEKDGEIALGSNAHVFAEDATKEGSGEKRVVQPGRYDGGTLEDEVGEYLWHQQLYGGTSECALAVGVTNFLNGISSLFARRSRFRALAEDVNYIDFAVARPGVEYQLSLYKAPDGAEPRFFKGLGFAGSDLASYVCKAKHIVNTGWKPVDVEWREPAISETLWKIGRTSEYTEATITDDSVHGTVDYGNYNYIEFDDLILTTKLLDPGDSGSATWLK